MNPETSKLAELEAKIDQAVQVELMSGDLPPQADDEMANAGAFLPEVVGTSKIGRSYDKQPEGRSRRLMARFQPVTSLKGNEVKAHEKLLKLARKKAVIDLKRQAGRRLQAFEIQVIKKIIKQEAPHA